MSLLKSIVDWLRIFDFLVIKVGNRVIYRKEKKGLDFKEVGILTSRFRANPDKDNMFEWGTVVYKQNYGQNKVSSHSAQIKDLKKV